MNIDGVTIQNDMALVPIHTWEHIANLLPKLAKQIEITPPQRHHVNVRLYVDVLLLEAILRKRKISE